MSGESRRAKNAVAGSCTMSASTPALVRGGTVESKEGGWAPRRVVVLEFPSMAQARKWYHSPEYKPLLDMRLKAADAKLILVEGV